MYIYRFERCQRLPVGINKAWKFFSDPSNLVLITPGWLNFRILTDISDETRPMYPGMIIHYRIRPLPGLSVRWVTEITMVREPEYFVDVQRAGPYAFWHHQHHFKVVEDGVEMRDILHYALPFGALGRLAHRWTVLNRLERIFNYRRNYLEQRFGLAP